MTYNALLVIECNRRVSGQGSARVLKGYLAGGEGGRVRDSEGGGIVKSGSEGR